MAADKSIFLVSQLDPAEDDPDRDALYDSASSPPSCSS
jgi:ATP-dependent Lon protease